MSILSVDWSIFFWICLKLVLFKVLSQLFLFFIEFAQTYFCFVCDSMDFLNFTFPCFFLYFSPFLSLFRCFSPSLPPLFVTLLTSHIDIWSYVVLLCLHTDIRNSTKVYNSATLCVLYFKRNVIHYKSLCFWSILIRISIAKSLMFMFVIAMIMSRLPGYTFRAHLFFLLRTFPFASARISFPVLLLLRFWLKSKAEKNENRESDMHYSYAIVLYTEIRCQFQHWNALRIHTHTNTRTYAQFSLYWTEI